MSLPRCLADFEGRWILRRAIRDARAGQVVRAEGVAEFRPDNKGLIYDEEVTLHIPGQAEMKGTRRYLWREMEDRIAVFFDDERYFHALTLGAAQPSDHHDCPPDSYDARYDFLRWPMWAVRWIVTGPRKSYEMETEYRLR